LELIAIPPHGPNGSSKKKHNLALSLSLRDQGSANTKLYFSESEKGGGGSQKSKLETSKNTQ
jgi:hypothetical protein